MRRSQSENPDHDRSEWSATGQRNRVARAGHANSADLRLVSGRSRSPGPGRDRRRNRNSREVLLLPGSRPLLRHGGDRCQGLLASLAGRWVVARANAGLRPGRVRPSQITFQPVRRAPDSAPAGGDRGASTLGRTIPAPAGRHVRGPRPGDSPARRTPPTPHGPHGR